MWKTFSVKLLSLLGIILVSDVDAHLQTPYRCPVILKLPITFGRCWKIMWRRNLCKVEMHQLLFELVDDTEQGWLFAWKDFF